MCGIICCGVMTCTKTLETPPRNLPRPPGCIVCPFCSFKGDACYRQRVTWFTLFFIPIFPVKYGETYLSCTSCGTFLGRRECFMCRNCRTFAPYSYSHCVRCGLNLNEDGNRVSD
ncbi:hypothetical protein COBT_001594 [Conglomerata obtusa]